MKIDNKALFTTLQSIAASVGIVCFLLIAISEVSSAFFKRPSRTEYVTALYEKNPAEYEKQEAAYKEACKPAEHKKFIFRTAIGLALLLAAILLTISSLSTACMTAAIINMWYAYVCCWSNIPLIVRLLILLCALILLSYFLYRSHKKQ